MQMNINKSLNVDDYIKEMEGINIDLSNDSKHHTSNESFTDS